MVHHYKRIFVVGHPGAGKVLFAKVLAERLGWQFMNADFELEIRIGKSLLDILGKQGAENFHSCEAGIINNDSYAENKVIVTDASIVCEEKNRQLLSSEFVVYLSVSTVVQLERLSRHTAPFLLNNSPNVFLDGLHQERDHLYEEVASLTINSDDSALENHVAEIIQIFSKTDSLKKTSANLHKEDAIFFHQKLHTPVYLPDQQAMCLKLLAQGKSSKEIARDLNISYRTVEGYLAKTMEALGCASSKELIALYHDQP